MAAFALAALGLACGDGGGGDDGTGGDDDTVGCGAMRCSAPDQACCELPTPSTDYCYAVQGQICEGGHAVRCDGSEDCIAGNVCCFSGGGSFCIEGPVCRAEGGRPMCHGTDMSPCNADETCCPVGPDDADYGACAPAC